GEWSWSDGALPLLFLTPALYGTYLLTPNPAHGALPLLLLMLFTLSWTITADWLRYSLILLFNVLLTYTGFGVFIGLVTPVLLGVKCWQHYRRAEAGRIGWPAGALVVSFLSAASFLIGYTWSPANDHFEWVHHPVAEYPLFVTYLLANF